MTEEERLKKKYGGFLDFGEKQGAEWLAEFRDNQAAIIEALDDWQQAAKWIAVDAQEYNLSPGMGFSVPPWFSTLTDILTLWCDAELHIAPTALVEFKRRMLDFKGYKEAMPDGMIELRRVPMTDDEIDACFYSAKETWNRIFHASLARTTADKADNKMNNGKLSLPDSSDLIRLAKKIKEELPVGGSKIDIARDFTEGDEKRATSLLRQLRRYPALLS
ncbi:MAG: hypothetical protein JW959_07025 [Pirellulales bacterium]|nr:hypothetical protein [Pirellulales bacterium]